MIRSFEQRRKVEKRLGNYDFFKSKCVFVLLYDNRKPDPNLVKRLQRRMYTDKTLPLRY